MYVNGEMIPVETVQESKERVNSSMMYLIHCKNLGKCYHVSLPTTTIKEGRQRGREEGRKEGRKERQVSIHFAN
jgi:predicted transposase YdaD